MSYPSSSGNTWAPDTSAKEQQLKFCIKQAQLYWNEGRTQQSQAILKKGIGAGKYVCENTKNNEVKKVLIQILMKKVALLEERQKLVQENKNEKNKPKATNIDKDTEKMIQALEDIIVCQKPNITWDDVGGLELAKVVLKESVCLPLKCPQLFEGILEPWKGILLYGPPGTGKTFLAKACASESESTFFSVSASDLKSKYVGDSEKLIKTLFKLARQKSPSIIFIDEVDSLCSTSSQGDNQQVSQGIRSQFLSQMQGLKSNDGSTVLVLGTTNYPWNLDDAILRRFQRRVYIPLPDKQTRLQLIKIKLAKNANTLTQEELQYLAEKTQEFSGADIEMLLRASVYEIVRDMQAATKFRRLPSGRLIAVQNHESGPDIINGNWTTVESEKIQLAPLTFKDIEKALITTKKAFDTKKLKQYEDWTAGTGFKG